MKHLRQNSVWKLCIVFACGTAVASAESMLGVHSFGTTFDSRSLSSVNFSRNSSAEPMSGKMAEMAANTVIDGGEEEEEVVDVVGLAAVATGSGFLAVLASLLLPSFSSSSSEPS